MTIEWHDHERNALAEAGIAIFEDRIILAARPPAKDRDLAELASHCAGELPVELVALWRVAFGGRLDYDLRCDVSGRDSSLSLRELFYPGDGDEGDIRVWIEHEEAAAREAAEELGQVWSGVIDVLPIGGFEAFERLYVVTAAEDHGSVWAWTEGLPHGQFALQRDSLARVADSVRGLFRTLALEHDPWSAHPERGRAGIELRDTIERLRCRSAADKLRALARATLIDWRAALADGTIGARRTHRRLALEHASRHDDVELLERLVGLGCDPREQVRAGRTAIDFALASGSMGAVRWLLDQRVPVESALRSGASKVGVALARELVARGAVVDEHSVSAAIDRGDIEVALFLCESGGVELQSLWLAVRARERAHDADQRAQRMEAAADATPIDPAVLRASASRLRELADRIDPTLPRP